MFLINIYKAHYFHLHFRFWKLFKIMQRCPLLGKVRFLGSQILQHQKTKGTAIQPRYCGMYTRC
jgi:hypothetical protein